MMWGADMSWGWWMGIVMVLIWGGLLFLTAWFLSRYSRSTVSDARKILERRFAKGEIDEAEFRNRTTLLSG